MYKRVSVTDQTDTGRNTAFHDNYTNTNMSRQQFVNAIKNGIYPKYMVKNINGVPTPVSKPDRTTNNNLG
ncbi:hypothetical protein AKUA1202_04880 [Apilactobacillus kunkeei]|uniref:DUF3892 domain-containing protein n=1 Tax=Apilactobacillus kunkeei TaxID=148814 RepID=A0A087EMX2_9LACO|nr:MULTISPECIES: hypothetical protein [Apilactobacillus]ALJ30799.1 hypothetical protein APS55_00455 [Apilactobacillus kunkeei]KFJ14623.1 hypothetical protein JI66_07220 [Apilactobacillus kunkeei]MDN2613269.1 hypothetical protein [Apilactobacillus sp. EABW-1NA]CAI2580316.1 hypothetical protein AKUA1802_04770 [Apilactobacillus kunkeei]CAI2581003.1 hypothetical protein AKUA0901_04770 [Apilactobacillus kunkeei]